MYGANDIRWLCAAEADPCLYHGGFDFITVLKNIEKFQLRRSDPRAACMGHAGEEPEPKKYDLSSVCA